MLDRRQLQGNLVTWMAEYVRGNYWESSCQRYLKIYRTGEHYMSLLLEDLKSTAVEDYKAIHIRPTPVPDQAAVY